MVLFLVSGSHIHFYREIIGPLRAEARFSSYLYPLSSVHSRCLGNYLQKEEKKEKGREGGRWKEVGAVYFPLFIFCLFVEFRDVFHFQR